MRVRPLLLPILALSFGFTLVACSGAGETRITTGDLQCQPGTSVCTLILTEPAGFIVTMTGNQCDARANEVRLTSPIQVVLTADACAETVPEEWNYSTPINPAGTEIKIEVESDHFDDWANPPGLRVTGAYPSWTVLFEDGYDQDYNDIVLTVQAVPAAS